MLAVARATWSMKKVRADVARLLSDRAWQLLALGVLFLCRSWMCLYSATISQTKENRREDTDLSCFYCAMKRSQPKAEAPAAKRSAGHCKCAACGASSKDVVGGQSGIQNEQPALSEPLLES